MGTASRCLSPTSPTLTLHPGGRHRPRPRGGRIRGVKASGCGTCRSGLCRQPCLAERWCAWPDPGVLGAGAAAVGRLQARRAQDAAVPAVAGGRSDRAACPPSDRARGPRLAWASELVTALARLRACPLRARSGAEVAPRGGGAGRMVADLHIGTDRTDVRACRIRRSRQEQSDKGGVPCGCIVS
jgi:hypothetical protein